MIEMPHPCCHAHGSVVEWVFGRVRRLAGPPAQSHLSYRAIILRFAATPRMLCGQWQAGIFQDHHDLDPRTERRMGEICI